MLDDAGSERPVLIATGECSLFACPLAATHPERLAALVLFNGTPAWRRSTEASWGRTEAQMEESFRWCQATWGSGAWVQRSNPSIRGEQELRWFGRYERLAQSPGALYAEARRFAETDVRAVLSSIRVPTLVLHRRDNSEEKPDGGRYLAAHIPGARFVELDGHDHFPWIGDRVAVINQIQDFLGTVQAEEAYLDRVLATVLSVPRQGGRGAGGRLFRGVRRARSSRALRPGDRRRSAAAGTPGPSRRAHGRGRSTRRRSQRACGEHRRTDWGQSRRLRGSGLSDREGSGRRLGSRLRGSWASRIERGSRRVAPFRRGRLITRSRSTPSTSVRSAAAGSGRTGPAPLHPPGRVCLGRLPMPLSDIRGHEGKSIEFSCAGDWACKGFSARPTRAGKRRA
jgi:hypothetical protein